MVIFVVNAVSIFFDKNKSHPPVATHLYSPGSLTITFELMEIQPGEVHILGCCGRIKSAEDQAQSLGMLRLDCAFAASNKESPESLVLEGANHFDHCNADGYTLQVAID